MQRHHKYCRDKTCTESGADANRGYPASFPDPDIRCETSIRQCGLTPAIRCTERKGRLCGTKGEFAAIAKEAAFVRFVIEPSAFPVTVVKFQALVAP